MNSFSLLLATHLHVQRMKLDEINLNESVAPRKITRQICIASSSLGLFMKILKDPHELSKHGNFHKIIFILAFAHKTAHFVCLLLVALNTFSARQNQ